MSNPMQSYDPQGPPPRETPAADPSSPLYDSVTPHGQGPAAYDIQAPMPDISGPFDTAVGASAAGVLYPQSPRQAATEAFLMSPAGAGGMNITGGFSGGGGEDWPSDVNPGMNLKTSDHGQSGYTGTGTD